MPLLRSLFVQLLMPLFVNGVQKNPKGNFPCGEQFFTNVLLWPAISHPAIGVWSKFFLPNQDTCLSYCYSEKLWHTLFLKGGRRVYCFGENLTFSNCFILILRQKRVLLWYQWWNHSRTERKATVFFAFVRKKQEFCPKTKTSKTAKIVSWTKGILTKLLSSTFV